MQLMKKTQLNYFLNESYVYESRKKCQLLMSYKFWFVGSRTKYDIEKKMDGMRNVRFHARYTIRYKEARRKKKMAKRPKIYRGVKKCLFCVCRRGSKAATCAGFGLELCSHEFQYVKILLFSRLIHCRCDELLNRIIMSKNKWPNNF